ncbi:MAG TPA: hypothetical protein GX745_09210 [Clostridiales bacterium]|nr:hypothetical protein [Clostridiales bacterium]
MDNIIKAYNWVLENWEKIVTLASVIIALPSIIASIINAIRKKKWAGVASLLENTAKLKTAIEDYVKEAEKLNANGAIKKEVVLAKARTLCVDLGIKYDEKKISDLIEAAILLSKTVNARDKDKQNNNQAA